MTKSLFCDTVKKKQKKEPVKKGFGKEKQMSEGIRFDYRNLEHTPEATFVVKQRGFVLICSIEKSDRTDSVEYDTEDQIR